MGPSLILAGGGLAACLTALRVPVIRHERTQPTELLRRHVRVVERPEVVARERVLCLRDDDAQVRPRGRDAQRGEARGEAAAGEEKRAFVLRHITH